MTSPFLFPDEIAEILRSAPHGSFVNVPCFGSVRVSDSAVDYDGIRIAERNYFDDKTWPYALRFLKESDIVRAIYDAIESGYIVNVNGQNILTIE